MNFIEILKSVSGVKPCSDTVWNKGTPMPEHYTCSCGIYVHPTVVNLGAVHTKDCPYRPILDLAPLLAKPKELEVSAEKLIRDWCVAADLSQHIVLSKATKHLHNLYVIGPQRASNLVYEIARQLGGTAAVAIPHLTFGIKKEFKSRYPVGTLFESISPNDMGMEITGYDLSLPIPPDATVLFVTDKVDEKEMFAIIDATVGVGWACDVPKAKELPYLLALVSSVDSVENEPCRVHLKVIALHQEK